MPDTFKAMCMKEVGRTEGSWENGPISYWSGPDLKEREEGTLGRRIIEFKKMCQKSTSKVLHPKFCFQDVFLFLKTELLSRPHLDIS